MITPEQIPDEVMAAFNDAWFNQGLITTRECLAAAITLVRKATLEEAAKVAEAFPARTHGNLATAPYAAAEQAGDEIAAAIRKLREE